MQLLARLMDHVLHARAERTTIVVATSGDPGGAAVAAFRGRSQVDVVVLYPHGRISEVQRRMMTTTEDDNIHALAIEGTFDDCQAIVKSMFNHQTFRDRVRLSGVNSINWARIVAQVVYYFTAAVALGSPHRKVAFTVPTGNFGDVYAGFVASRMGLPVDRLVVATNVNDILVRSFATGAYEHRDVVAAPSPSMNIQVSSNFGRLLFENLRPRRKPSHPSDGLAGPVAPLQACPRPRSRPCAQCLPPTAPPSREAPPPFAPGCARPATAPIRATAVGLAMAEKETLRPVGADGGAVDRAPGQVSGRGCGRLRCHTQAAGLARRFAKAARAGQRASRRSGADRKIRIVSVACGA